MTGARILSVSGKTDGIRWGDVGFGNSRRRFHLDTLTGSLRLYTIDSRAVHGHHNGPEMVEDDDAGRRAAVLAALAGFPGLSTP